jgi:hypothetical protein
MPELLPARVLTELRRTTLSMACMLPLAALPAAVLAQNVPPGLRACAAQSDPGQRLDCYDREMKRLLAPPARPAKSAPPAQAVRPAPPAPAAIAIAPAAQPPSAQPDLSSSSAKQTPDTAAETPATAKAAQSEPAAPHRTAGWKKFFSGGTASHVTAHVVGLERSPGAMVIHLDNGQVWRQVGRASGDLTLHTGDEVTIEEHLGSYWLSARYVSDMQVRQEPR